jgi:hypothetical protein
LQTGKFKTASSHPIGRLAPGVAQLGLKVQRQGDCSKVARSFARTTCEKPQMQTGKGLQPIATKNKITIITF